MKFVDFSRLLKKFKQNGSLRNRTSFLVFLLFNINLKNKSIYKEEEWEQKIKTTL